MNEHKPSLSELGEFVSEAILFGWPDNTTAREGDEFPGFWNTHYSRENWRYLDLWCGASTDAGVQFVFRDNVPVWSCTYRGGLTREEDLGDLSVDGNTVFGFLVRALRAEGTRTLPIRGPDLFGDGDLSYSMTVRGDLASFLAFETIVRSTVTMYERVLIGGRFGDGITYGTVLGIAP